MIFTAIPAVKIIAYLQDCIDRTGIVKLNRSKGGRPYSSCQEYE